MSLNGWILLKQPQTLPVPVQRILGRRRKAAAGAFDVAAGFGNVGHRLKILHSDG